LFVAVNGTDHWLMHHYLEDHESPADYTPAMLQEIVIKASGLPAVPVEILSVNPWIMAPAVATQWRSQNVFLVGDAAARVSPAGGLGMNNGLQCAHNLAWKLAEVLLHGQPDSLLDSYEQERLPAAQFTNANSQGNASEVIDIITAAMMGQWDKAKSLISQSRRAGNGYGQDFGIVYESHAITSDGTVAQYPDDLVNDYIPQARPGHRAPLLMLSINGQTSSLLNQLGYQFTALLAKDADPALFKAQQPRAVIFQEGQDFKANDPHWHTLYGISSRGGVLIRPDGYVSSRIKG